MKLQRVWTLAAALVCLPACGSQGTSGIPFESVAVGTWAADGGGTVTFAADGTGETDSTFLLDQTCPSAVPIQWLFSATDRWDGISIGKSSTADCSGNLNVGFSLLSVTENEFVLGNVFVDPPATEQTFTRR